MSIQVTEEGKKILEVSQVEANREAAADLQRIEEDVKREAEAYVVAVDGDGDEKSSVEAAATAFDFDEAEAETGEIAEDVAEHANSDLRFGPHGW